MSGWRAVVADDGVEYYIHEPTGTVSWTKPDDDMLREEIATTAEDEVVYSSDEALIAMAPESATPALITDSLDTLNATVSNLVALVAKDSDEPSTGSLDRCWVTLCDPVHDAWEVRHTESQGLDHGEVYYVNKVSGESSWEKPVGFDVSKPVDYADLFNNVSVVDAIASLGLDCDEIASNILALTGHRPACDVTPLYHKLAALLWIVEHGGEEVSSLLTVSHGGLAWWLLCCVTYHAPTELKLMIGKVLLSALEVCKPLPLMLLSRGTVISQRIFAKVIDEMNLAVSRKAGDWATIKPLRTYSVPSYKAFQTASPFAAKVEVSPSRAVSPPPFHVDVPLDARVIDETALDVWKSILVILCETLAAMCEPSADSAGAEWFVLSMPAAENVVDCLLSSQMEGLPGAVDVLSRISALYLPRDDVIMAACKAHVNCREFGQAFVREINSLRCTASDSAAKIQRTQRTVEFGGRLLQTDPVVPFFFTNDLKVLIDVMLQQFEDLQLFDLRRLYFCDLLRFLMAYSQWPTAGDSYRKTDILGALEVMLAAGNEASAIVALSVTHAVERVLDECNQLLGDE